MKFYVYIAVERKEAILDPQGKATEHALKSLGFGGIEDTRIGKYVRLLIEAGSEAEASKIAEGAAGELLSNPIMETYRVVQVRQHQAEGVEA